MTGTSRTEPPISRDEVYRRNMAALFRWDGRLAQRIDETEDDGTVVVEASRAGAPTASVRLAGSTLAIQLHSRVDPQAEAKRLADAVEVGESFCYIVGGFGLGHHLKALRARLKGDVFLAVLEPNVQILKKAMETVDLAELFEGDRCIILTSTDKNEVQTRLEPHNNLMMIGTQFVSHPASERLDGEFQAAMRQLIADHMTYCRMCLVTLVANSRLTNRNVANNLPTYLATPPIDVLRERFRGYPAIVVSA
ncbi:MAG: motility associated factor glycosyltransferase family protein, partial [Planctomycetes bacterium]|nr:motility associated factor glycosyltransferase family protein [Planctomycetota bacterium]